MNELVNRLARRPFLAGELLFGSLLINVLALASPLFVMQVLNRYIGQGVDATLFTLTSGVLLAIFFEFVLRRSRLRMARGASASADVEAAQSGYRALIATRGDALNAIGPETRKELSNSVVAIETAYNANNLTSVLDAPFALFFVAVLFLIEPMIALVAMGFIVAVFLVGVFYHNRAQRLVHALQETGVDSGSLLGTATREPDTVRGFNAQTLLETHWQQHIEHAQALRRDLAQTQGLIQTVTQSGVALMSVAVIGLGAVLVISGKMDVGAMIGANILAARALQPVAKLTQLGTQFARAREAMSLLDKLSKLEREPISGAQPRACKGALEFRDIAYQVSGSPQPLFERLDVRLAPGQVCVITGANGAGKTTAARLILGLAQPSRGQVLVDGQDINQISLQWWRNQVMYLPQEPALLNASIADNIRINCPDADDELLDVAVTRADLRAFVDASPQGLETPVLDNGWRLSEGIRRRIALARALIIDGAVMVIDEPTEGLDRAGCVAVQRAMAQMAEKGGTIVVMSHDPDIINGPHVLIDLNAKPIPIVKTLGIKQPAQLEAPDTRLLEHDETVVKE